MLLILRWTFPLIHNNTCWKRIASTLSRIWVIISFIQCSLLSGQNLLPTFPTMQHSKPVFSQRFWCVMCVVVNLAFSCLASGRDGGVGYRGLVSSRLSNSTAPDCLRFQTKLRPTLTQVTSLGGNPSEYNQIQWRSPLISVCLMNVCVVCLYMTAVTFYFFVLIWLDYYRKYCPRSILWKVINVHGK